jgi:exodeoxyribonuclease (lambda-induced)
MEWGVENEPNAVHLYEHRFQCRVQRVGFILPDATDSYGGSPDGIVDDDGLLEVKCLSPKHLIRLHADGVMPVEYRAQVQGLLLISRREWCDFWAWHPHLEPFWSRVYNDIKYQTKIADGILKLLQDVQGIESRVRRCDHELIVQQARNQEVQWNE